MGVLLICYIWTKLKWMGGQKGKERLKPQNPGALAPDRGTSMTDITVHPLPAPHPHLHAWMIRQYKKASEEDVWGLATGEETGKKGRKSKARFVLFCFVFPSARIRSDSQGERRLKAEGTLSKEDIHQDRGSAAPSSPRGAGSLGSIQSHALGGEAVSRGPCQLWDDLIKVAIHMSRLPTGSEPLRQNYSDSFGRHQREMRKPGWGAPRQHFLVLTGPHCIFGLGRWGHLEWHSNLKAGQLPFKHFSWIKIPLELSHFY